MAIPVAAKVLLLAAKSKKAWKILAMVVALLLTLAIVILLLPFLLFVAVFSMLNPSEAQLPNDPYYKAIASVQAKKNIGNDLSVVIAKSIDLLYSGNILEDEGAAENFIQQHFVGSYERVIESLETMPDGSTEIVTRVEIEYYFYSATEMLRIVKDAPYNFQEQDIRAIQELYLVSEGNTALDDFVGLLPMPVSGYVTSGYGNRFDPISGDYFMHPAIDFLSEWHAPVCAIADGVVVASSTDTIYGNNVTIRHQIEGQTIYSFSAHLSRVDVQQNETVRQGQTIGLEGGDQTYDPHPGRTTGHHLHFEIWETSTRSGHVNPSKYLKG